MEITIDDIKILEEDQQQNSIEQHNFGKLGYELLTGKVWTYLTSYHKYMRNWEKEKDLVILQYNGNIIYINATEGIITKIIVQVHKYNREELIADIRHTINEFNNMILFFPESFNHENVFYNIADLVNFEKQLEEDINLARKQINKSPYYTENPKKKVKIVSTFSNSLKNEQIQQAINEKTGEGQISKNKVKIVGNVVKISMGKK